LTVNAPRSSKKFAACALIVAMMTLTGCGVTSKPSDPYVNIYQPNYLYLKAGARIPTLRGEYSPQVDETWVHPRVLEELDRQAVEGKR
jgi:hypothetical protein